MNQEPFGRERFHRLKNALWFAPTADQNGILRAKKFKHYIHTHIYILYTHIYIYTCMYAYGLSMEALS